MERDVILVVAAGLAIIGLSAVFQSLRQLRRVRSFRQQAVRVQARVMELRTVYSRGAVDIKTQSPVVAFYTRDGQQVQTVSDEGAQPCPYRPGETATVWYDPQDPTVIAVKGMGSFVGQWLRVGFGTLFAVIGLAVILVQAT